jgi:hypothetical protein
MPFIVKEWGCSQMLVTCACLRVGNCVRACVCAHVPVCEPSVSKLDSFSMIAPPHRSLAQVFASPWP